MFDTELLQTTEFLDYYQKAQAELQEKAKTKLHEVFSCFWELNPGLGTVSWDQYAPYFNDGDACTFSVHEPEFSNFDTDERELSIVKSRRKQALLASLSDEDKELLGIVDSTVSINSDTKEEWTHDLWAFKPGCSYGPRDMVGVNRDSLFALSHFLQSSPMETALNSIFGDDCRVSATRSGFAVTECEHD